MGRFLIRNDSLDDENEYEEFVRLDDDDDDNNNNNNNYHYYCGTTTATQAVTTTTSTDSGTGSSCGRTMIVPRKTQNDRWDRDDTSYFIYDTNDDTNKKYTIGDVVDNDDDDERMTTTTTNAAKELLLSNRMRQYDLQLQQQQRKRRRNFLPPYFLSCMTIAVMAYVCRHCRCCWNGVVPQYWWYDYIPPGPPPFISLYTNTRQQPHHQTTTTATTTAAANTNHISTTTVDDNEYDNPSVSSVSTHEATTSTSPTKTTTMLHSHTSAVSSAVSWNEYIHDHTHQLIHSLWALGIQTPYYVLRHLLHCVIVDLQQQPHQFVWKWNHQFVHSFYYYFYKFHNFFRSNHNTTSTTNINENTQSPISPATHCQWNVIPPTTTSPHTDHHFLESSQMVMIGQEMAVDLVRNAMYTWIQQQQQQQFSSVSRPPPEQTTTTMKPTTMQQPLILFATGYEHTGKHTLADHIMSFTNCDHPTAVEQQQQQYWYSGAANSKTAQPQKSSSSSSSSLSSKFVLHIHGHEWKLQDYEMDIDRQSTNYFYRRRLYRKLIHFMESHFYNLQRRHNNHYYQYDASTTGTSPQLPPPNMILISNIEDMDSFLLVRLLSLLQQRQPHHDDYWNTIEDVDDAVASNANTNHGRIVDHHSEKLRLLCQHTIVYLTSNRYGVSAIARHLRTSTTRRTTSSSSTATTTTTTSSVVGLISDIRDAVQKELQVDDTDQVFNSVIILPFLPFTHISLGQLLRHRMNEYYSTIFHPMIGTIPTTTSKRPTTIRLSPKMMMITDRAIQSVIDERNVEYIEWRSKPKRTTATTTTPTDDDDGTVIKIVVEGANAINDHTPIMTKLYAQLHQVLVSLHEEQQQQQMSESETDDDDDTSENNHSMVLLFDYDTSSTITFYDRGMFQLCDNSTVVNAGSTTTTAVVASEHDDNENEIVSSSSSLLSSSSTHQHCKIIRRFQLQ